jgi:vacuole morphology and inheritance protein 14
MPFRENVADFFDEITSAELEITVNLLIQVDKLVQLLESPVFTCKHFHLILSKLNSLQGGR